jgi:hypothetical protein
VNIYYNALPAGQTVTCYIDEIRAVHALPPLSDPEFFINGDRIQFPVKLNVGDRLIFRGMEHCALQRKSGAMEIVKPLGASVRFRPGLNDVAFSLPNGREKKFQVTISVSKLYPQ